MGKALQLQSGFLTAPTATLTKVTNATGDTQAVPQTAPGSNGWLLDLWADLDTVGFVRFRSPNFHDNVNGIQAAVKAVTPQPLLPTVVKQVLVPNDTLTVEIADNGAGAPSGVSWLAYYENLPGADANLFRWEEIVNSIQSYMTCKVAINASAVSHGDYKGSVGLGALQNQFKSNRNYALLGYTSDTVWQTIGLTGPDTSNRRLGGPCPATLPELTRDWFVRLSGDNGLPCIPVINAANVPATNVDAIDTENLGAGNLELIFALLN